jgi:transposase-like protein
MLNNGHMGGVAQANSPTLLHACDDMDAMFRKVHETLIECRLCHELKDQTQYEQYRRQCNRCRNRYRERVRDPEKRCAKQRVRAQRHRLKVKQARLGIGLNAPICAQ